MQEADLSPLLRLCRGLLTANPEGLNVAKPTKELDVIYLDIDDIEEPLHNLRQVDEDSQGFADLVASMKADGFWPSHPLEVDKDPTGSHVLVDGLHRLTAAKKAKVARVPVVVLEKSLTETERLERAIAHNATVIETRPVEYARAVQKWLGLNPGATLVDASKKFRKSPGWVAERLKVAKLEGDVAKLTDAGKIPLETAGAIAKLQAVGGEVNAELLRRVQKLPASEVVPEIEGATKALREKRAQEPREMAPARLRPLGDMKAELDRAKAHGEVPCYVKALEWSLRQDPASLQACMAEKCPLFAEGESSAPDVDSLRLVHLALGAGATPDAVREAGYHALVDRAESDLAVALVAEEPAALAKRLGVDAKTVRRWIAGERSPAFDVRKTLLNL